MTFIDGVDTKHLWISGSENVLVLQTDTEMSFINIIEIKISWRDEESGLYFIAFSLKCPSALSAWSLRGVAETFLAWRIS